MTSAPGRYRWRAARAAALAAALAVLLAAPMPARPQRHAPPRPADAAATLAAAQAESVPTDIELEVGESRVLAAPGAHRVAVGNGQVISAMAVDAREVVLFARQEGTSTVHIWTGPAAPVAYTVRVYAAGLRRMRIEVDKLLEGIPAARSTQIGGNIVIEGNDLSDDDRARIAALAERYPGVLDFTGQVGWDRMVLLDVQVVELPRSRLLEFGVRWDSSSQGGLQAGLAWDGGSAAGSLTERPGQPPLAMPLPTGRAAGYFGVNALLAASLSALAQRGEAVLLAQPQLLARSGSTASFLAGGEVPYATTDSNGGSNTQFKPYGVSLQITPRIDRNGTIRSRIEVEASSIDASMSLPSGPALRTRRAMTEFNVRSGQTLVLGGFLSRERSVERTGLPLLSDIPLLGNLFSTRRTQVRDTELAIFVTPSIVSHDYAGFDQTARRAQRALQQAFPEPPQMGPLPPATPGRGWVGPNGAGSQWQTPGAFPSSGAY
ncbi:secretory apparatus [Bordetella ansorpii]|uniref:Type IV pilus biogenesis and competence protein PilQ n=1 Tax=Bordetella ansorpii TaxID=288768 RepID=A0A157RFY0_9BORD|nr:pilus assembly protein N-terminal domain-containing protein [Bordetella ansorpii]SAI56836.1 secretory apparatus [Bordetella ansorpii]